MKLLIGTSNAGKLGEYEVLLAGLPVRLLSLRDVGLADMDVPEDATTLEGNAGVKVVAYSHVSGLVTLADDTGLFVDALDGAPGVYPARYGGPGLTMAERRQKLLTALDGLPDEKRSARFECVIAVADPGNGETITVKGVCAGRIAQEGQEGGSGFGYDAVFIPEGYDIPWSLVPMEDKNRISHRGQAARLIAPLIERMVQKHHPASFLFPYIIDEGIELRVLEPSDASTMFELISHNRDHLDRWVRWSGRVQTLGDTVAYIQQYADRYTAGTGFHAGLWVDGKLVGGIACPTISRESNKVEIGYWLDASHTGKGLVTRACRRVITDLFTRQNIHRIEIQCVVDNVASRAVAERLGFTLEGVKRESEWITSSYQDHALYSLLENEWKQVGAKS